VIDWTMRREGVSFRHAVELLRDGVAPTPVDDRRAVRSTVTRLASPLPAGANDRELLERVVGFYAQTFRDSPQALSYLESRGLRHRELVERFRLGYAKREVSDRCCFCVAPRQPH
jgi:DNA primase